MSCYTPFANTHVCTVASPPLDAVVHIRHIQYTVPLDGSLFPIQSAEDEMGIEPDLRNGKCKLCFPDGEVARPVSLAYCVLGSAAVTHCGCGTSPECDSGMLMEVADLYLDTRPCAMQRARYRAGAPRLI